MQPGDIRFCVCGGRGSKFEDEERLVRFLAALGLIRAPFNMITRSNFVVALHPRTEDDWNLVGLACELGKEVHVIKPPHVQLDHVDEQLIVYQDIAAFEAWTKETAFSASAVPA